MHLQPHSRVDGTERPKRRWFASVRGPQIDYRVVAVVSKTELKKSVEKVLENDPY